MVWDTDWRQRPARGPLEPYVPSPCPSLPALTPAGDEGHGDAITGRNASGGGAPALGWLAKTRTHTRVHMSLR